MDFLYEKRITLLKLKSTIDLLAEDQVLKAKIWLPLLLADCNYSFATPSEENERFHAISF